MKTRLWLRERIETVYVYSMLDWIAARVIRKTFDFPVAFSWIVQFPKAVRPVIVRSIKQRENSKSKIKSFGKNKQKTKKVVSCCVTVIFIGRAFFRRMFPLASDNVTDVHRDCTKTQLAASIVFDTGAQKCLLNASFGAQNNSSEVRLLLFLAAERSLGRIDLAIDRRKDGDANTERRRQTTWGFFRKPHWLPMTERDVLTANVILGLGLRLVHWHSRTM